MAQRARAVLAAPLVPRDDPFAGGFFRLLQSGAHTLFQVDRNGGGNGYVTLATFQNTTASSFNSNNFNGVPMPLTRPATREVMTGALR